MDGRAIGWLNGEGHLSQIVYDEAGQKITVWPCTRQRRTQAPALRA